MSAKLSRRGFVGRGGLSGLAAALFPGRSLLAPAAGGTRPVRSPASTASGWCRRRWKRGVGYGGLPNEDGIVELDACVMHGPTRRAGAVAALRDIRHASRVARTVMEHTDHVLLVGEGALRFAEAHGFQRENLLTEESRGIWRRWKEGLSGRDGWGPGLDSPSPAPGTAPAAGAYVARAPMGTIVCLALNETGDLSGAASTSGRAFKIPGRVGDTPIVGAGLFVDNAVGAAAATGRGEESLKICGAHTVVEGLRRGLPPTEACLEALRRIAANYQGDRAKLRQIGMDFVAVTKTGEYGAASLWSHEERATEHGVRRLRAQFALGDERGHRLAEAAYLYEASD